MPRSGKGKGLGQREKRTEAGISWGGLQVKAGRAGQQPGVRGVDLPKGGGDVAQMCPGEGVRAQV